MSASRIARLARSDLFGAAWVALAALAILSRGLHWGTWVEVESIGGDRVLRGEVPYRDFWTVYAPGSYYLVAALLRVFGRELSVIHSAAALLAGACGLAFYVLLRRAGLRTAGAAMASVAFLVALWTPAPALHTYAIPRLALLLGWERVLRALRDGARGPLIAAGLAFGVAAWFKHDVAAYATLGSALAVFALRLRHGATRDILRDLLALGLPALALVLPLVGAVALVAGADAWQDLIAFPLGDFRVVRGEEYPSIVPGLGALVASWGDAANPLRLRRALSSVSTWGLAWTPVFGLATAAAVLAHARLAGAFGPARAKSVESERDPAADGAIVLSLACAPFFWMAAHVQQNTHVFSLGILAALALAGAVRAASGRRVARAVVAAMACLLIVGFSLRPVSQFVHLQSELGASAPRALAVPGATKVLTSEGSFAELRPLLDFIRANVPPDEAIYVGLPRHDAIVIGDGSLYFLANRASATRYHELHPGISDREEIQREMLADIDARGVRCVVIWKSGIPDARLDSFIAERRATLPELGSTWLDDQLAQRFERVRSFEAYDVHWRRGAERPWESAR